MYDVIVVGGGPTGSHVAARLAGAGHSVLVLERRAHPGGKSGCTGIVGQECVDTFHIDESVILHRLNSASLFSPSGKRLYLRRQETQACALDRAAFDLAMAVRAQKAGAEYRFGQRVTDLHVDGQDVILTVASSGREYTLSGYVAVIAAGFSPALVTKLGLGGYRDFAIGAQALVPAPDIKEVEVYFGEVVPGFFAWLVPAAPGMVRAGLLSRRRPGSYLSAWLSRLAAEGKITDCGPEIALGAIPLRPLHRTFGERMLVVGDAAGQVKPTTGGGIYYGLIGADFAADTLLHAFEKGDFSSIALSRYERAWRRKLGGELRSGYWARRLFERLAPGQIDRLFDIIRASGVDEALLRAPDISFDWHGRTIAALIKYRAIASTLGIARLPFRLTGKPRKV